MYKYEIEIQNSIKEIWNYITIFATTDKNALLKASYELAHNENYKNFYITDIFKKERCDNSCKTLSDNVTIISSNQTEDKGMLSFKVNWNDCVEDAAKLAATEIWENETYPNKGILTNYLVHTYKKITSERKVIKTNDYALFNTGLFTKYYEPIYAYTTNETTVSFITDYDLGNLGIESHPERANYFTQPELLLFDWHYPINVHYKHILADVENSNRLPDDILNGGNIITILDGAINNMKKRVSANYKLAIPQYFDGKIQLLLPLCLKTDNIPDLALVVTKIGKYYQGHTCITLDMAYNNARLIAKPESNWLVP